MAQERHANYLTRGVQKRSPTAAVRDRRGDLENFSLGSDPRYAQVSGISLGAQNATRNCALHAFRAANRNDLLPGLELIRVSEMEDRKIDARSLGLEHRDVSAWI